MNWPLDQSYALARLRDQVPLGWKYTDRRIGAYGPNRRRSAVTTADAKRDRPVCGRLITEVLDSGANPESRRCRYAPAGSASTRVRVSRNHGALVTKSLVTTRILEVDGDWPRPSAKFLPIRALMK